MVIRHDVDRIPTRHHFERLLHYYARTNVRCSWYWLPDRLDGSLMCELCDRGHEIGLHAMFGEERRDEIRTIESVTGRPVTGECFHGSGTEYHRGALSVMASAASGLAYSELNPGMYGYPYTSFPMLGDDGSLEYETRLVHMTFSVTTDGIKGKSRKTDVTMDLDLARKWAGLGYYTCLLNHPDMSFEPMAGFVERMRQDGLVCKTMTEVADWWRRTHRQGAVRVRAEVTSRETVRLSVTGEVLPGGLAVCLYGWTAVRMEAPASNSEVSLTHDGEKRWVMLKFGESAKADLTFALSPG